MIRKIFSAVACAFLAVPAAQAQSETQFIRTSLVAGIGANQIDGDQMAGYFKPGLILGAAARFSISEKLAFQPEVLYVQKGSRTTLEQEEQLQQRIIWKLGYVEIPVLLTFEFFPDFSLFGGGAYGYLLGANLDNGSGNVDQIDRFNKSDLLWVAGLDYEIVPELSLNMRMEKSLVSVTKQTPSFYNKGIAVTLRYHLGQ